jgi:hypothetical protein
VVVRATARGNGDVIESYLSKEVFSRLKERNTITSYGAINDRSGV